LAFSLYAVIGIGTEALFWGVGLIIAGLPIYFVLRRQR
jgi:APA family basic amino acid/polyamine antiporter